MTEIQKIILKARKLLAMTFSSNVNEAEVALNQLNKLKSKWKLSNSMIEPIITKDIIRYNNELVDISEEYLVVKIGELCGNTVIKIENSFFLLSYKGTESNINKALNIIFLVENKIDEIVQHIDTTDKESIKYGMIVKLVQVLYNQLDKKSYIPDKEQPIEESDISEYPRTQYNKDEALLGMKFMDNYISDILEEVKEIFNEND